jgi:vancomycin resistance protein VanJ
MLRWLRRGLAALALLYLAALATLLGLVASGSAREGWPALLREMMLFLFVPVPFLLLAALLVRARAALVLISLPIALFAVLYAPQFVPRAQAAAAGPSFRVLSFNVGAARGLGQPGPVLRAVREVEPDIVCLVEARTDSLNTIGAALLDAYPYQAGSDTVFIFSRFPLLNARSDLLRTGAHDSLLVDVEVGDRLVALAAAHLLRIDAYQGLGRGLGPLLRAGSVYRTDRRDGATAELAALMRDLGGPRLLVGDFNMTQWSHSYGQLSAELRDSHLEAGWGFGHTYPTALLAGLPRLSVPLLRIDYIFNSADLVVLRAGVGPDGGSDHLPVVADLAFR